MLAISLRLPKSKDGEAPFPFVSVAAPRDNHQKAREGRRQKAVGM